MKIVLEFDNREAADEFTAWWLDGGGEQYLGYNSDHWDLKKGYIRVKGTGKIEDQD